MPATVNVTIEYLLYTPGRPHNTVPALQMIRNMDNPAKNTHAYPQNYDVPFFPDMYFLENSGMWPIHKLLFISVKGSANGNFVMLDTNLNSPIVSNRDSLTIRTGTTNMLIRIVYAPKKDGGMNERIYFDAWDIDACALMDNVFVEQVTTNDPMNGTPTDAPNFVDSINYDGYIDTDNINHITAIDIVQPGNHKFYEWAKSNDFIVGEPQPIYGETFSTREITVPDRDYSTYFAFYKNIPAHSGGSGNHTKTCKDRYNDIVEQIRERDNMPSKANKTIKQKVIDGMALAFINECPLHSLPPGTNYSGRNDGQHGPVTIPHV